MSFNRKWNIFEMELWQADYFNMEVQAFIEIDEKAGTGEFQFGLVSGSIDGELAKDKFKFTWDGVDECDEVSGSGWVKLKEPDILEGAFKIHQGDKSKFLAHKA